MEAQLSSASLRHVVDKLKDQKLRLEQREQLLLQQQAELDRKEQSLQQREAKFQQIAVSFRERQLEVVARQNQLQALERDLSVKMSSKVTDDSAKVQQLMATVKQLELEHSEIKEIHMKRIQELEEALAASRKEELVIADLEANVSVMEKRFADLTKDKAEVDSLRDSNRHAREAIARLEEELIEYQKEANAVEIQLEEAEVERKRLLLEVEELVENNRFLNEELLALKREIEAQKGRVQAHDVAKQLDQVRKENDGLRREIEEMTSQIGKFREVSSAAPLVDSSKTAPQSRSGFTASADGDLKVRVKASRAKEDDLDITSIANAVCHEEKKEEREKKGSSGDANEASVTPLSPSSVPMPGDVDISVLMSIGKEFKMKWPYSSDDGTFQVQKNEVVILLDPSDPEWYKVRSLIREEVGYVPAAYMKRVEEKKKNVKSSKEIIAEVASTWKADQPQSPSSGPLSPSTAARDAKGEKKGKILRIGGAGAGAGSGSVGAGRGAGKK